MRHVLKVKTVRKTGLLPVLSLLGSLGLISMAAHAEMNQVAGERDSIRAGDRVGESLFLGSPLICRCSKWVM